MKIGMNLNEYFSELLIAGTGVAASITSYIQGQKNAKTTELDNVSKAIQIWQDSAETLKTELHGLQDEMKILRKNHEDCEETKRRLEKKVQELDEKVCIIEKRK